MLSAFISGELFSHQIGCLDISHCLTYHPNTQSITPRLFKLDNSDLLAMDHLLLQKILFQIDTTAYPLVQFIADLKLMISLSNKHKTPFIKIREKSEKLLRGAEIVGYHLLQGQSRLNSLDISACATQVLEIISNLPNTKSDQRSSEDNSPSPDSEANQHSLEMLKILSSESKEDYEFQAQLSPDNLRTFRYFKLQATANHFNSKHIPKLVIANFTQISDYLGALFLLHLAGDFQIENQQIVRSAVKVIPLMESVEDFYRFPIDLSILLSLRMIRQYIRHHKEFLFMIACSDTPRENGHVAANSAIITSLSRINGVFAKGFYFGAAKEGANDLGLMANEELLEGWRREKASGHALEETSDFSEITGTVKESAQFWDRVYSQYEVIQENEKSLVMKDLINQKNIK